MPQVDNRHSKERTGLHRMTREKNKKLKKRRDIDDGTVMYSYLRPDDAGDPAEKDTELDSKLTQLDKEAEVRINKVFEEFVDKQVTKGQNDQEEDDTDQEDNSDEEVSQLLVVSVQPFLTVSLSGL